MWKSTAHLLLSFAYNVRVIPTRRAIDEAIELSEEIFSRVFRRDRN